jgi:hypothetical protein
MTTRMRMSDAMMRMRMRDVMMKMRTRWYAGP